MNKLQTAVIEQLGYDEICEECLDGLKNVAEHGADGGFSGFIYYSDTLEFFANNRDEIIALAEEMAESFGCDALEMIAGFNCLKDLDLSSMDIAAAIFRDDSEHETSVRNALAWFALEEVARDLTDGY